MATNVDGGQEVIYQRMGGEEVAVVDAGGGDCIVGLGDIDLDEGEDGAKRIAEAVSDEKEFISGCVDEVGEILG